MPDDVLVKLNKMAQAQKPIGKAAKFGRGMSGAVRALTYRGAGFNFPPS
jgi:hypothetical protein